MLRLHKNLWKHAAHDDGQAIQDIQGQGQTVGSHIIGKILLWRVMPL